ncbi:MAG: MlaD family protein [Desulfatibacillaceae bacterium]
MQLEYSRMEKIVGAFVILTVALLLSAIVLLGRGKDWFESYVSYYALFRESYNLSRDAEVKMARTTIGKVRGVTLDGNLVRVDLRILEEYAPRITMDAVAVVESPTIIGSEYVSIKQGSGQAPEVSVGGRIPSRPRKSIASILEDFEIERMARLTVQVVEDVASITAALSDPEGPLFVQMEKTGRILARLEEVVAGIERGEGSVGLALRSDSLHREAGESLASVRRILASLEDTASRTPRSVDTAQQGLDDVREVVENLRRVSLSLQSVMDNLEKGSRDLPVVTRETRRGIGEIRRGVGNMDKVVESVKRNPLIRSNLPGEPEGGAADANVR